MQGLKARPIAFALIVATLLAGSLAGCRQLSKLDELAGILNRQSDEVLIVIGSKGDDAERQAQQWLDEIEAAVNEARDYCGYAEQIADLGLAPVQSDLDNALKIAAARAQSEATDREPSLLLRDAITRYELNEDANNFMAMVAAAKKVAEVVC